MVEASDAGPFQECVKAEDFAVLLGVYLFRSNDSDVVSPNVFEPGLRQSVILPNGFTNDENERRQILMFFVCCTIIFFFANFNGRADRT